MILDDRWDDAPDMPEPSYTVTWGHGASETHPTYQAALSAVRAVLSGATIGHDGDIPDGGHRTLFWACRELSENDDGARAAGSITCAHAE